MNTTMKQTHTPGPWDLEEIPYETNDKAGGWYLHFDPTGESTDAVLYISKAHCTEADANLIAAAPEMLAALELILSEMREGQDSPSLGAMQQVYAAVCKAKGEV